MSSEEVLKNCNLKMKKAFDIFSHDLASLRTGRANAAMLDIIKVDVYGQMMPINQLATISTPDPRSINVQVWDQNIFVLGLRVFQALLVFVLCTMHSFKIAT